MEEIKNKFNQVESACREINDLTNEISKTKILFFQDISVDVKFNTPEHCFDKLIGWSYVRFIEISGKNLDFIQKKFDPFNLTVSKRVINFPNIVHAFRTLLFHNLDLVNSQRDIGIKNTCLEWINAILDVNEPNSDEQWKCKFRAC